jgi:uncharacterized protein YciU (UPF0263 family)
MVGGFRIGEGRVQVQVFIHKLTEADNPDNVFTYNLQFDDEGKLELIVFSEYRFFVPAKGK